MPETGFIEGAGWDEQGETPSYNSFGLITGGGLAVASPDNRRAGIGGQAAWSAGGIIPACTVQADVTEDSLPLIAYAIRASYPAGALTAIMAKVGTAAHDWTLENGVLRQLTLSGQSEQPLRANYDMVFLEAAKGTGGMAEPEVGSILEYYEGAVTIGESPYDCRSFECVINNNVNPRFNLDTKVANSARFPGSLSLGAEVITLRVNLGTYLAYDVLADTPARNVAAVITYTDGVNPITLTFTDLVQVNGRNMPFVGESDDVVWDLEFQGAPESLEITT